MRDQAETSSTSDPRRAEHHGSPPSPCLAETTTLLLVENRLLMGEVFAHAIEKAAGEWNVRVIRDLDGARPAAALAVFNFSQRDPDPLFVNFVVQQLRAKLGDTPLFFIIDSADPAVARIVGEAGLQGWISASMGFDAIVSAIRQAMIAAPPPALTPPWAQRREDHLLQIPATRFNHSPSPRTMHSEIHLNLTEREIDVLRLLRKGKQNKVIAHTLNISESTAKVHIRNIMRKFHLRNRTEVALMCGSAMLQQGDGASES